MNKKQNEENSKRNIRTYVIVAGNVPDLVHGKMAAQACHAQSMLAPHYAIDDQAGDNLYYEWQESRGFGTVIVLYAKGLSVRDIRNFLNFMDYSPETRIVHVNDPTYPVRNARGDLYTCQMETCTGILVDVDNPRNKDLVDFISTFPLY